MLTNTTSMTETNSPFRLRKLPFRKIAIGLAIAAAIVIAFKVLPIAAFVQSVQTWVESLGAWAPIGFILAYVVLSVALIPASVLTLFAGAFFGLAYGSVYVSIASTAAAAAAFLIGRHLARNKIEKRLTGNGKFAAVGSAVANEGWKIVVLTRLTPIFPFALQNYAYGLTKVKFSHYLLASWIGMMPGTILYVYIGSLGKAAGEGKSPAQWAGYAIGLIATIAVTIYVTKIAKRALNERITNEA